MTDGRPSVFSIKNQEKGDNVFNSKTNSPF